MTRHARLALAAATSLAMTACNPSSQPPSGTGSPAASPGTSAAPATAAPSTAASASAAPSDAPSTTPTVAASPVATAPPAQAAAGREAWLGAQPVLDDATALAIADLRGDGAPAGAASARKVLQTEAELTEASVAVALTAEGRTAAKARRAAVRTAAGATLDPKGAADLAIADAFAKATPRSRPGGGSIRLAELTVAGAGGNWPMRLIRAVDAQGDLVYAWQQLKSPDGKTTATRTRTLREDGGAAVKFVHATVGARGTKLNSAWTRNEAADGTLTGAGIVQIEAATGSVAKTMQVAIKGTDAAPLLLLKDPAAKLEVEVTLPLTGTGAATLIRLDAAGARVPLAKDATP